MSDDQYTGDSGTYGDDDGDQYTGDSGSDGDVTWGDIDLNALAALLKFKDTLVSFADTPLKFLRKRIIPLLLGALLGFTDLLANSLAAPFEAIQTGLQTLGNALVGPLSVIRVPFTGELVVDASGGFAQTIFGLVGLAESVVRAATAPLGPWQPFGAAALWLLAGYLTVVALLRAGRGVLDSIPGLSGLETMIFG